jgi:hypothetical protein
VSVAAVWRRHRLSFLCFAIAALIGIAGVVDHQWKQARAERAEVAEWFCTHTGTRCGGASSNGIEARWNEREVGYEIALVLFGGLGAAGLAVAAARTRRS